MISPRSRSLFLVKLEGLVQRLHSIGHSGLIDDAGDPYLRSSDELDVNAGLVESLKHSGGISRRILHPRPHNADLAQFSVTHATLGANGLGYGLHYLHGLVQ